MHRTYWYSYAENSISSGQDGQQYASSVSWKIPDHLPSEGPAGIGGGMNRDEQAAEVGNDAGSVALLSYAAGALGCTEARVSLRWKGSGGRVLPGNSVGRFAGASALSTAVANLMASCVARRSNPHVFSLLR